MSEKRFPIIPTIGHAAHPMTVPWSVAELAYSVYAAKYGRYQSLERMAERGGFHANEMDAFLPDWRERASELARVAALVGQITLGDVDTYVGTGEPHFSAHVPCHAWAELDAILSPFRVPSAG